MPLNDVIRQRLQPLGSVFTSNRILMYSLFSSCAVVGAVINACRAQSNFYSVSIYLARSSRSVLILANFGFLLALLCGRILQRIFFGPLQPREIERLYDQTWMFVTESLLAFTIFRDEFDIPFVLMFGFLLFVKCFHWLMADRVESMDQTTYPGPPTLFHIRMNALFSILWCIDIVMFCIAAQSTLNNGVGGMVLFASEYAILLASALNSMARYVLSLLDVRRAHSRGGENAPPWENKSMYIFYIELVTDFLKLSTYLTFFMIILTFYGLPLNIIRDVYLTARSFITRLRALVRYHNATRDMDRRYPDATEAELADMSDRTCIICREEMVLRINPPAQVPAQGQAPPPQDGPNMTPKKLPCGHIFHFQCLRSWLERQQSCPTCRRTVLETNPPNQAPNQGARPPQQQGVPPPQPGAALQPAPGGGPLGGPLGLLGRLFGGVAQPPPPLVPGQFAQGDFRQFAPPNGIPQGIPAPWPAPGQAPQPGVWYQVPPFQPQQPQPQQPLQQPPMFRGFYGPGGAWHPWPVDPQWAAAMGIPDQQQQQHGAGQTAPPAAGLTPTPTVPATATSGTNGLPPSAPAPSRSQPETSPNPREAAALAALRRTNPTSASDSRASVPATSSSSASPPTSPAARSQSTPTATFAAAAPTTSSAAPPTTTGGVPPLIPVYDFHVAPPRAPTYPYNTSPAMPYGAWQAPAQGHRAAAPPPPPPPHAQGPSPSQGGPFRRYARGSRLPPLAELPQTLTEEQLERLDGLTREAIEERLRVLESVSGTVWRCVEELVRVRSALPVAAALATASGSEPAAAATTSVPAPAPVSAPAPPPGAANVAVVSEPLSELVAVVGSPGMSERSSSEGGTSEEESEGESASVSSDGQNGPSIDNLD